MKTGAPPSFGAELWGRRYAILYLAAALRLAIEIGRCYVPYTGFSSLIFFGDQFAPRRLTSLSGVPLYTYPHSSGYDGQFYAQLAVAGNPFDPGLKEALDSPSYRARRILLPALLHVLGLGRPAWIIQAYALANLVCFLTLAAMLARWWFPPTDLHNLVRWIGTLFGAGMMVSVTRSLTDGPALLLIALGGRLVERNRRFVGATILAAAGLVRETSVLCAAVFAPTTVEERRAWPRAMLAAVLCVVPTLLWAAVMSLHYGGGAGSRNFDLPFVCFARKVAEIHRFWRTGGLDLYTRGELFAVVGLGTQAGFLLLRPRPGLIWWRIGAAFSVLGIFLGWAVWEGAPSAAPRALLPLTLAFNVLAPRTRRGLVLLLLGNLTVLSAFDIVRAPTTEQTIFERGITCHYRSGWHGPERAGRRTWHWAGGSANLVLDNPTPQTLFATVGFEINSVSPRTVTLRGNGGDRSIALPTPKRLSERYGPFALPPGESTLAFTTAEPPWIEPRAGGRPLTFAIYDFSLAVTGAAGP